MPDKRTAFRFLIVAVSCGGCAEKFTAFDAGLAEASGWTDASLTPSDWTAPEPILLKGQVLAPNGEMPISGALVYLTDQPPPEIPDKVYCDKCITLDPATPHAESAADGTFTLSAFLPGKRLLVTQKGAFRRVRAIDVPKEGMTIGKELTTLPAKTDPDIGDTIPKMVVLKGAWDAIEDSLAKLGLGKVDSSGSLERGTEPFTIYECALFGSCTPGDPTDLLKKPEVLAQYQILFVPCTNGWLDAYYTDPAVQKTLKDWVQAGGRLYATDYEYDLIDIVFPGYIVWEGASSTPGTAELMGAYDAPAIVNDPGLKDWLDVQGLTAFDLLESWTIIDNLFKLPTPDPDGTVSDLEPTGWISGRVPQAGVRPMTVSFSFGCGRVLFSAYHTEGGWLTGAELLPQERALLYIILEMAVCLEATID